VLGFSGWVSFLAVVAAAAAAWLLGRFPSARTAGIGARADAALEHRAAPWIAGALTLGVVWYAWGGLARIPVISDEAAYLLQAELFARGMWKAPGPPHPEFFEQSHIIVTPVLASKYYPGHSLMMTPGALLGLPALMPLLLSGLTGALMFLLARMVAGGRVALLTWLVWISCFPVIYYRATYLSQMTSAAMWLIAWWCLLHWRRTRTRGWMLGLAAAVGMVAITRPLTAVALAIPIGILVVRDCAATRSWRQLGAGVVAGTAVLCVLPVWNYMTLGAVKETPHTFYSRQYMPHDRPGFSYDTTIQAERALPGSNRVNEKYIAWRRDHTLEALPRIAAERARIVVRDMWYEWRAGLIPLAILGAIVSPAAAWFGYAAMLLNFGLYLLYAGPAGWTVYYMESVPMLAFASALGIAFAVRKAAEAGAGRARSPASAQPGGAIAIAALALVTLLPAKRTWGYVHAQIDGDHAYFERFAELTGRIPEQRAIVFVRHAATHHEDLAIVRNPPGHADARLWIAYDRGAENQKLLDAAPDRRPYLFDETSGTLTPIR
jgi:hypothetical protein